MKRIFAVIFLLVVFGWAAVSGAEEGWKEYRALHFIIYYKDAPEDFIKEVERTAETYYQQITSNLGFARTQIWSWDKRAKIYIYRDADDYIKSAKQSPWSHGVAAWIEKEIRTFPAANGFFDSILPHELGHIIFREFIGSNPYVPLWLDEGVAMYQEKARRWGVNSDVKKAIEQKKFIPLSELSTVRLYSDTARDFVELYYAEAASAVYYLITEFGEFKFVGLCRQLKEGTRFEQAFKNIYIQFKSLDAFNQSWVNYLKR
ncbi:MAG TPA: peptidase MA family metallohydrolase [Candidatus Omnitrophota bacterium]|nr:peptidase MA family metallohydrolase [Candidatus Omnitrophota bacterium]HPD85105.1 peptidase MA family metallohydrolase [Candidatus Omnitrophota bacterium]HRZ03963.1 peptidase MA family metallohydrolase [Candidatus Omnitrophota bacterium]